MPGAVTTLAERLRHLLEKRQWSARQLCRVAGLAESHAAQILHGADPRLSTVVALAAALDVSVQWLATGDGPEGAPRVHRRDLAARVAREAAVDDRAIALVLRQPENPARTTLDWLDAMRLAALAFENTAPQSAFRRSPKEK